MRHREKKREDKREEHRPVDSAKEKEGERGRERE